MITLMSVEMVTQKQHVLRVRWAQDAGLRESEAEDKSALNLSLRLGAFNECLAGVHGNLENPTVRQPRRCDS